MEFLIPSPQYPVPCLRLGLNLPTKIYRYFSIPTHQSTVLNHFDVAKMYIMALLPSLCGNSVHERELQVRVFLGRFGKSEIDLASLLREGEVRY